MLLLTREGDAAVPKVNLLTHQSHRRDDTLSLSFTHKHMMEVLQMFLLDLHHPRSRQKYRVFPEHVWHHVSAML